MEENRLYPINFYETDDKKVIQALKVIISVYEVDSNLGNEVTKVVNSFVRDIIDSDNVLCMGINKIGTVTIFEYDIKASENNYFNSFLDEEKGLLYMIKKEEENTNGK